jgi:hypothetical protein
MPYPYWQYFLALEAEFGTTTRYVEVEPNNYTTYSIEYARLLLSACSEIDVVCKLLCAKIAPATKVENINSYRATILDQYPKFPTIKALIPLYGIDITPWHDWSASQSPFWWRNYNKVKHERDLAFPQANLENVIHSLAGLFCLLLYYYQPEFYKADLQPFSKIFDYENTPRYRTTRHGVKLPDF